MNQAVTLFFRLIVRPLGREPARTALTTLAVALGVAVVVAIHLAGEAATGSFRSSLESLTGEADFEISTVGGLDEKLLGELTALPYPFRFSPRVEGFALVEPDRVSAPVFGFDLIGDVSLKGSFSGERFDIDSLTRSDSLWAGRRLASAPGETLRLTVNDTTRDYTVHGLLDTEGLAGVGRDGIVVMDISTAQQALGRKGRLDRIDVFLPSSAQAEEAESVLRGALPAGVTLQAKGTRSQENHKMLSAFRWNVRVLSYISLVVGAFLIYNTIAVSVVRRRTEIGVARALGATRRGVQAAFLAEAGLLGFVGSVLGLALGRLMADGAVELMAATVNALYVSSTPGEIVVTPLTAVAALAAGVGVSLLAAWMPAREAALVAPTEAMARGRHEYHARQGVGRTLAYAALPAAGAWLASLAPPVAGKPLLGYLSALLLIVASAMATPALVVAVTRAASGMVRRAFGAEGVLASRGLVGALPRTSVLVATLASAVAMLVSVAIMVGSYRETVTVWLDQRLGADFYVRPPGRRGAGQYPTMDAAIPDRIENQPEIEAVDRFRAYPIRYEGRRATLGAGQAEVIAQFGDVRFLSGRPQEEVLAELPAGDHVIVSEAFADKHSLRVGDSLRLPMGDREPAFRVIAIYYDYSNENGYAIMDRSVLLKYLPDPSAGNLAVYLKPAVSIDDGRTAIERATAGREVLITANRALRTEALRVFDRTFTITYALEAVAILVAIMGMAGALLALVIDRRGEIGVLRFLGASAGQIRRVVLFESGFLGLLSNLIGLGLGALLSLILIFVVNKQSFGWTIQFHAPVGLLLGALTLVYVAAIIAGLYPARIAARLSPIEVVHEE